MTTKIMYKTGEKVQHSGTYKTDSSNTREIVLIEGDQVPLVDGRVVTVRFLIKKAVKGDILISEEDQGELWLSLRDVLKSISRRQKTGGVTPTKMMDEICRTLLSYADRDLLTQSDREYLELGE